MPFLGCLPSSTGRTPVPKLRTTLRPAAEGKGSATTTAAAAAAASEAIGSSARLLHPTFRRSDRGTSHHPIRRIPKRTQHPILDNNGPLIYELEKCMDLTFTPMLL